MIVTGSDSGTSSSTSIIVAESDSSTSAVTGLTPAGTAGGTWTQAGAHSLAMWPG